MFAFRLGAKLTRQSRVWPCSTKLPKLARQSDLVSTLRPIIEGAVSRRAEEPWSSAPVMKLWNLSLKGSHNEPQSGAIGL